MKLSHSKLNCILSNPAEYYLVYKMGIKPKEQKPALAIGSAVHYGLEHSDSDLSEYYNNNLNKVTQDQVLSEAMVEAYLKLKDDITNKILDGSTVIEEYHEIELEVNSPYNFLGIIDLLYLTDKGFIVVDYKTSSQVPDFSQYLDQIYRYMYLLKMNFPDIPIYKTAIINIRKGQMRKKTKETDEEFFRRIKWEYESLPEEYITYHVYDLKSVNEDKYKTYIDNLMQQCAFAETIESNNIKYINYKSAEDYGGSPYKPIYYKEKDCEYLYTIKDKWIQDDEEVSERDCKRIDMECLFKNNVLNKYEMFKKIADEKKLKKQELFRYLKENYVTDNELLETYWKIYETDNSNNSSNN